MSEEVTIEFKTAEKLMYEEIMERELPEGEDPPELEDWAEETLKNVLYQNYRQ